MQAWTTYFRLETDRGTSRPKKQFYLMGKELNIALPRMVANHLVGIRLMPSAKLKSNTTPSNDTECVTSVAMPNSSATVSPNSNPTIVMLLAEAGFVSKHNVVPFHYQCPSFIAPLTAQTPVVSS
ncbi:hypothetical protein TNCV_1162511 [Trichonephila clavipes]|nr:hypothetical protein TNCV_1162511 [Trichonephila clavipes]